MTPDAVLALARESGLVMLYVAGPLLAAGLVTGVIMSARSGCRVCRSMNARSGSSAREKASPCESFLSK